MYNARFEEYRVQDAEGTGCEGCKMYRIYGINMSDVGHKVEDVKG